MTEMLRHIKEFMKGVAFAIGVILFDFISFFTCYCASIFGAFTIVVLLDYLWYFELPPFAVGLIQGLLLIKYVQANLVIQEGTIGHYYERAVKNNPVSMSLIPLLVKLVLSVLAIYNIFLQYEYFHEDEKEFVPFVRRRHGHRLQGGRILVPNLVHLLSNKNRGYVCCFILSLSYLIYNSGKVIHLELKKQLVALRLIHRREREFPSLVTWFFFFCQCGLTIGYLIPIFYCYVIVALLSADRGVISFYLCVIAAAIGFFGSLLESRSPFPKSKGVAPWFLFERNALSRVSFLKYGLLPFVYFYFLETSIEVEIKDNAKAQDVSDGQFLLFTLSIALIILQSIKILSVSFFIPRLLNQRRLRRQRREAIGQNVEFDRIIHDVNNVFQHQLMNIDIQIPPIGDVVELERIGNGNNATSQMDNNRNSQTTQCIENDNNNNQCCNTEEVNEYDNVENSLKHSDDFKNENTGFPPGGPQNEAQKELNTDSVPGNEPNEIK